MRRTLGFWGLIGTLAGSLSGCSSSHMAAGEAATITSGGGRTYYIAADEVMWDYAPSGKNLMAGRPFDDTEKKWMEPGPLIRGQVGETIRIVFKNNTKFPASMHPHGVFYKKDSEGAVYDDGTSGGDKADDGVPTGGTHTYTWEVPERAGPTDHEGSTVLWMYHSHVDEIRDVASGLIGPMIVSRRAVSTRVDGSPTDVDREIVAGFIEVDENSSWYVEENIKANATDAKGVKLDRDPFGSLAALPDFGLYFRETINGFSFGNTPGMTMKQGTHVRWYVMSSTNFEIHAPHWHGNVVTSNQMRTDVGTLLPMGMFIADMVPDNAGKWMIHCHVGPHLAAGMQAGYTVEK